MSNENQPNRTQLTDLPVTEQEMTAEEMENVQGGRIRDGVPAAPPVAPIKPPEKKDWPIEPKAQPPL